jgi:hypothetical protein
MFRATVAIASLCHALSCQNLVLFSDHFPQMVFKPLTATESHERGFRSGRAAYVSHLYEGESFFLYHTLAAPYSDGIGRWVIGNVAGSNDEAKAFIDSWAVMPNLIHAVNDPSKSTWKVAIDGEFIFDETFRVECTPSDNTIYFEVRNAPYFLSGFYVQIKSLTLPMFSHVRSDFDAQYFLYKLKNQWIISDKPGSQEGLAYVVDEAILPGDIKNSWHFAVDSKWIYLPTTIVQGAERNVYTNLRRHRFIPGVMGGQSLRRLRNDLPIPSIGLGTASLETHHFQQIAEHALLNGYRMFDLAREFNNEGLLAGLLHHPDLPKRNEVFLISKVWPTHLGFGETSYELSESLKAFQDPYIDMYMIHWPRYSPLHSFTHKLC